MLFPRALRLQCTNVSQWGAPLTPAIITICALQLHGWRQWHRSFALWILMIRFWLKSVVVVAHCRMMYAAQCIFGQSFAPSIGFAAVPKSVPKFCPSEIRKSRENAGTATWANPCKTW
ncbi:hypothetical protein DLNHIDIE_03094 [Acidithiobacillus thiooxidans ATCC 19377]|uniref:Uncharacterized protein n=1 Tax=Acidithiobacillus thiooxidans ATCC 19377 TaxID=637390 RepID=A0A543Q026_ACITH|nr:hypothetical protein DLNHIDIE_03094 [Acidithiobacillus thiooxidans ATCC 19377]